MTKEVYNLLGHETAAVFRTGLELSTRVLRIPSTDRCDFTMRGKKLMKRMLVLTLMALVVCLCAEGQRLPETAVPETYDLTFEPNLEKATFAGDETIHVRIVKPTVTVTLNAAELELQEAS